MQIPFRTGDEVKVTSTSDDQHYVHLDTEIILEASYDGGGQWIYSTGSMAWIDHNSLILVRAACDETLSRLIKEIEEEEGEDYEPI